MEISHSEAHRKLTGSRSIQGQQILSGWRLMLFEWSLAIAIDSKSNQSIIISIERVCKLIRPPNRHNSSYSLKIEADNVLARLPCVSSDSRNAVKRCFRLNHEISVSELGFSNLTKFLACCNCSRNNLRQSDGKVIWICSKSDKMVSLDGRRRSKRRKLLN